MIFKAFPTIPEKVGELHSSPIIRRYENNPLLTAEDMPYPASYVFNAGVVRYRDKYVIAPRINYYQEDISAPGILATGLGFSDDGIKFDILPEFVRVHYKGGLLHGVNDARLTVLEDELYLSFCFETPYSERPAIAKWRGEGVDFDAVFVGVPQQRNMVLYPEKINGLYMRAERPSNQWRDPFHIWYGFSPDLKYWGDNELLLGCEDVPWANRKIGAGPTPLKTDRGWLMVFHAVDDDPERATEVAGNRKWSKRYTAGAALFDLEDPTKLIAITKEPLIVAEAPYETGSKDLWTEFTIFPCGAVLEDDNETLRIYYGAGDTSTNLAFTTLTELWSVMTPCSRQSDTATKTWPHIIPAEEIRKYEPKN